MPDSNEQWFSLDLAPICALGNSLPVSDIELSRHVPDPTGTLRPWDAADEFLLAQLIENRNLLPPDKDQPERLLVLNDDFGALTVAALALQGQQIQSGQTPTRLEIMVIHDSFSARQAIEANVQRNFDAQALALNNAEYHISSQMQPQNSAYNKVLVKIPKNLDLLRHQLYELRGLLASEATVTGGAMTRHMHTSTIESFQRYLGPCKTTLARKKARLVLAGQTTQHRLRHNDLPATSAPSQPATYEIPQTEFLMHSEPASFSAGKLDIGTRFMLQYLPKIRSGPVAMDLGCGNGILGIALQLQQPDVHCSFVDSSAAAIKCSLENQQRICPTSSARFLNSDCLEEFSCNSVHTILCNPPFHEKYHTSTTTAVQLFEETARVLKTEGELFVVANLHLNYPPTLKKLFRNCSTVARNNKFSVYRACH